MTPQPDKTPGGFTRAQWAMLAAVVIAGFLLRAHDFSRIFLWTDETGFSYGPGYFNELIYGPHRAGLVDFAWVRNFKHPQSTNTWGWPAVVWIFCRVFGATLAVARLPSVLIESASVAAIIALAMSGGEGLTARARFAAAMAAGIAAAVSMPKLEFAQRVIPYVAVSCMSACVLIGFVMVLRAMDAGRSVWRAATVYAAVGFVALCLHPSLALPVALSAAFLAARAALAWREYDGGARRSLLRAGLVVAAVFLAGVALNRKDVRAGYHSALAPYYHKTTLSALPQFAFHAWDLATYHLNPFYNPALYQPQRWNPALIPLVMICAVGWALAVRGAFGKAARELAYLGAICVLTVALLSLGRIHSFPFGGVRQTLFIGPFLFVFTGLGFAALLARRATAIPVVAAVAAYALLWGINIPRFYADRLRPFDEEQVVRAWRDGGKLTIWTNELSWGEVRYIFRNESDARFASPITVPDPKAAYLLVSTHGPVGDDYWLPGLGEYYRETNQRVHAVYVRNAAIPRNPEYRIGSLYYPPSGMWMYKVEGSNAASAVNVDYSALKYKYRIED